jgi:hypothetical protein
MILTITGEKMNWIAMNAVFYICLGMMLFFGIKGSITNVK